MLGLNNPGEGGLEQLGQAVAAAGQALGRRLAVIASGDMSHRLTRSAPGGFHPDARRFDEAFVALLRKGEAVDRLDPDLREAAGEDVVDSTRIALAAAGARASGRRVLSYEGPFGVGYGVAILFEPPGRPTLCRRSDLPAVARRAVETRLRGGEGQPPFAAEGELAVRQGVFVTLWAAGGELRGCMGSLAPVEPNLVEETWRSAGLAAFRDFRFAAVSAGELDRIRFEVTVLGEPEPAPSRADLDPAVYGVVVQAADGRMGLLLPDIEGVDTIDGQLAIARRKAGIGPDEPVDILRFTAQCFEEAPQGGRT